MVVDIITTIVLYLTHQQDALLTRTVNRSLTLMGLFLSNRRKPKSSWLWGVVKLNGELGNSFAVKILDM